MIRAHFKVDAFTSGVKIKMTMIQNLYNFNIAKGVDDWSGRVGRTYQVFEQVVLEKR